MNLKRGFIAENVNQIEKQKMEMEKTNMIVQDKIRLMNQIIENRKYYRKYKLDDWANDIL